MRAGQGEGSKGLRWLEWLVEWLEKRLDESRARLSTPLARETPAQRYGRRRVGGGAGRAGGYGSGISGQ